MGASSIAIQVALLLYCISAFDPVEHAEFLIKEKIIPTLKEHPQIKMNTSFLRLCLCSLEQGCYAMTEGWIPALIERKISTEDRWWYHRICVTDGECYQAASSHSEIVSYGCVDQDFRDKYFHDALDPNDEGCMNRTQNDVLEWWICCRGKSYCANTTILKPPPPIVSTTTAKPVGFFSDKGPLPFWQLCVIIAIFLFILLVFVSWKYLQEEWLVLFARFNIDGRNFFPNTANGQATQPAVQFRAGNGSRAEEVVLNPGPSTRDGSASCSQTVDETSSSTKPLVNPCVGRLYNQLDSTERGSGGGTAILQVRTLAQQIKVVKRIGTGRFGSVFLGEWKGENVAVKVFKACDEMAFRREVLIHETRMLRHPNVIRYIASDRFDRGSQIELWLVTEYYPYGSLRNYVARRKIDFLTVLKFIRSIANGITFLHSELIGVSNSIKPAIAHRDIKSRNIMVKNDLECAIADLGLSVVKDPRTGNVDLTGVARSGTVRYLAPEILSNRLHAGVMESHQMADIYSFALVMWELLMRCEDYGIECPDAPIKAVPFGDLIEYEPKISDMRQIVCVENQRPPIQYPWKNNERFMSIVDVMETCWFTNPTARYTAIQVRMRITSLMSRWDMEPVLEGEDEYCNEESFLQ